MEASTSAAFFDDNQLSNRKKSLADPFNALFPTPFFFSINILVNEEMAPNYE